ncbi:MAG: DEAD/DEAH box helicase [Gammaproteobacteria bacterium]|nr:DEAD/DEAH box helicase [Gammaproteobacteria bacterium]
MSPEELEAAITEALEVGFRQDLLAKGQSRSMIMREGILPEGHPNYPKALGYNLLSYGYGLLSLSLQLGDSNGDANVVRSGFEQAGNSIEAAVANGDRRNPEYGFHITVAACAFHLGRFSARAYSLLAKLSDDSNTSALEDALSMLMRRSLDTLDAQVRSWCGSERVSDDSLLTLLEDEIEVAEVLSDEEGFEDGEVSAHFEAIDLALTESFHAALGTFLLYLETGENALYHDCIEKMHIGLESSSELGLVTQWWAHRLAIKLLSDLWSTSFHSVLPLIPGNQLPAWDELRSLFIASLYCRAKSEIELWPSQLEAAIRSIDESDNLVASLPTSAGKTRIAELAILRCLAGGRRVIFVTPLRALSAQTEVSLEKTFSPLGFSISTLYGSIGTSRYEQDAMKGSHIVVATPEKIDFALRNEPDILDDVGLIVLDEGHMIGLNEREIRYETQIQRLLKRPDAHTRRVVCLSAILPDGDEFEDFVAWLRRDEEGEAIVSDWRPTRLRFGELRWQNDHNRAWLELNIGEERSFVPTYIEAMPPQTTQRRLDFPKDQHELVIAATWKLLAEGHSVLIFCPLKKSVEPYADRIITAHRQGFIQPLLPENEPAIQLALSAGEEWLGRDHPILKCLKLGVAVHHGSLPTPFRREVERLLRAGILQVTVSSPTLAQGLNLSATTILFHSLHRNRELIKAPEFKNIIGRAGRAFVDVEGLILHPMFDEVAKRRRDWKALKSEAEALSLESGLFRLVVSLLVRMQAALGGKAPMDQLLHYVLNNAPTWEFPTVANESVESTELAKSQWEKHLAFLDTSILNLLGEYDIPVEQLAEELDRVLASSLWERRLNRRSEEVRRVCDTLIKERASYIWSSSTSAQRKGYYLAGIGLSSGHQLDAVADEANECLVLVNAALAAGEAQNSIAAYIRIAEILFEIPPFAPKDIPDNWVELLSGWLQGQKISDISPDSSSYILDFVEDAFVYRLPWGMEAIRVRAQANQDRVGDFSIDDFELSLAVPALETGTLNIAASVLMQSGFSSRIAAISAIESTGATFVDSAGLRAWLASEEVRSLFEAGHWPTNETAPLWQDFTSTVSRPASRIWRKQEYVGNPIWDDAADVSQETFLRLHIEDDGRNILLSRDFVRLGVLKESFPKSLSGLLISRIDHDSSTIAFTHYGEDFT